MGVAHIRCMGGRSWALPTPVAWEEGRGRCPHPHKKLFEKSFLWIFKNFPEGKFYEVDDLSNRALLPCEALFFCWAARKMVGIVSFQKGLSRTPVPTSLMVILNLGILPYNAIGNWILKFHPHL